MAPFCFGIAKVGINFKTPNFFFEIFLQNLILFVVLVEMASNFVTSRGFAEGKIHIGHPAAQT